MKTTKFLYPLVECLDSKYSVSVKSTVIPQQVFWQDLLLVNANPSLNRLFLADLFPNLRHLHLNHHPNHHLPHFQK